MRSLEGRKSYQLLAAVLFLLPLYLPLAHTLPFSPLRGFESTSSEKRTLAPFPEWEQLLKAPTEFSRQLGDYIADHFYLRSLLISWHNRLKIQFFAVSPVRNVLLGKNGWLFFHDAHIREWYDPSDGFTQQELARWAQVFRRRREELAERGIDFLLVIVPNKHSIYPDKLPHSFRARAVHGRNEVLTSYLREHAGLSVLDLHDAFRSAAQRVPLYYRTDSHWNAFGAHTAAVLILEHLAKEFGLSTTDELPLFTQPLANFVGDLATMLSVGNLLQEDTAVWSAPEDGCGQLLSTQVASRPSPVPMTVERFQCPPKPYRVLLFSDSFGVTLSRVLARAFGALVSVQAHPDFYEFNHFVEDVRPQLVIEVFVSRLFVVRPERGRPLTQAFLDSVKAPAEIQRQEVQ